MISKRYGKPTPIRLAHVSCHDRFNREIDNPRLKWWQFKKLMEPMRYGEGIFASD